MAAPVKDPLLTDSILARHAAPAKASDWAEATRNDARARLLATGAPVRRDEYWRYTDPAPLTADEATDCPPLEPETSPVFDDVGALRLVFVDGVFAPDLSDEAAMDGVEIQPLSEALNADIH